MALIRRKLGTTQLACVEALVRYGRWSNDWGYGWQFGTKSKTELILDSLVKRGLATKSIETVRPNLRAMVWVPTEAGRALVAPLRKTP